MSRPICDAFTPPPGLVLAEAVLGHMKEAARGTAVWEDSAVNTNEMLHAGTRLCDLEVLDIQQVKDISFLREHFGAFLYKHWLAAQGVPADSTSYFVARNAEPGHLTLRTRSRLGYLEMLPRFAKALDGLPLALSEARSWTWDLTNLTPAGRPTHLRIYALTVLLENKQPFKAKRWLTTAAADVCSSQSDLADQCIFQMLENAKLSREAVCAYEPTRSGWLVDCADAKSAKVVAGALFAGCRVEARAVGARAEKQVQMAVTLP